jgi:predicted SAM-dependent methyltransferase
MKLAHSEFKQKYLNFGCGKRYHPDWTNIDFESSGDTVKQANLLNGFPFPNESFDFVYSSHVLEHFSPRQARFLLSESHRVLKPGGTLRVVLPDLENTCREYIRILEMDDSDSQKLDLYKWATTELLDQMVREVPGGELKRLISQIYNSRDPAMIEYIKTRTEIPGHPGPSPRPTSRREKRFSIEKFRSKLLRAQIRLVSMLLPRGLRDLVFVNTAIGEKHKWMYDRFGLTQLLHSTGYQNVAEYTFDTSAMADFDSFHLDSNPDKTPYKRVSIYFEGKK